VVCCCSASLRCVAVVVLQRGCCKALAAVWAGWGYFRRLRSLNTLPLPRLKHSATLCLVSQSTSPFLKKKVPSAACTKGVAARSVCSAYYDVDINNDFLFIMVVIVVECIVFSSRLVRSIQVVICSCAPYLKIGAATNWSSELKPATRVIAGNRGRSRGYTCAVPLKCFALRLCLTCISRPMR
jgi:hypothetical protein